MDKLLTILISSFLAAPTVHATEVIKILEGDSIEPYAIKNNLISQGAEVDIIKAVFRDSDFTPVFVFVPLARVTINFDWPDIAGSARMTEVGKKGFLLTIIFVTEPASLPWTSVGQFRKLRIWRIIVSWPFKVLLSLLGSNFCGNASESSLPRIE